MKIKTQGIPPSLKGALRICARCGKPFEPHQFTHKYCSYECRDNAKKPEQKICRNCGQVFLAYNKNRGLCSLKCRKEQYETKKGFKHSEVEWLSLREFIMERDNYTCQRCGQFLMDIGLAVHHKVFLRQRGTNSPENLIILCNKCHRKAHSL